MESQVNIHATADVFIATVLTPQTIVIVIFVLNLLAFQKPSRRLALYDKLTQKPAYVNTQISAA